MRRHYNAASRETPEQRRQSAHLHLRQYHNQLKRELMQRWVPHPPRSVLDLACGKGGDVSKWSTLRAASYVGVDVAEQALAVARQRYAHVAMPQQYVHANVLAPAPPGMYDVVSVQFAMHYFGGERLTALWARIRAALAPGGVVLCTYTDGLALARLALSELQRQKWTSGTLRIRLALAEIEVPERSWRALQAGGGAVPDDDLEYCFSMGSLVSRSCPERFLWPATVAAAVAAQPGLAVVAGANFQAVPVAYTMGEDEWAVSRLYRTLVVRSD
jgi:SAM-dependent methyltransferase